MATEKPPEGPSPELGRGTVPEGEGPDAMVRTGQGERSDWNGDVSETWPPRKLEMRLRIFA